MGALTLRMEEGEVRGGVQNRCGVSGWHEGLTRGGPVFPSVNSVLLRVRAERTALPERVPGTDGRGPEVSQAGQFGG